MTRAEGVGATGWRSRASRWHPLRRWFRSVVLPHEVFRAATLSLAALLLGVIAVLDYQWAPASALTLVVIGAGLVLGTSGFGVVAVVVVLVLVFEAILRLDGGHPIYPGTFLLVLATAVIAAHMTRTRTTLGVVGTRGESMLVDLRDRLRAHGALPSLPPSWAAEVVLRPAGGAQFSGDFLVATLSDDESLLEVVLVDVSGKGVDAGTRALLLSGAFAGLLGSLPPEEFLPAANRYLIRQNWGEGFATAVHLVVDLESGEYVVRNAGHPPAAHFLAGSGTWQVIGAEGPLLGVMSDQRFGAEQGRLAVGDALLLYTDGLIEAPGMDLTVGIDKLLGQAEHLVTRGFRNGARKLIDAVASGHLDDRALVLVWRQ